MKRVVRFSVVSVTIVGAVVALAWFTLDPAAGQGVLIAGCVAVPLQIAGFAFLVRMRDDAKGLMAAWVGGVMARLAAIVAMAVVVLLVPTLAPAATMIAMAGFLFGLALLEHRYLDLDTGPRETA